MAKKRYHDIDVRFTVLGTDEANATDNLETMLERSVNKLYDVGSSADGPLHIDSWATHAWHAEDEPYWWAVTQFKKAYALFMGVFAPALGEERETMLDFMQEVFAKPKKKR